MLKCASYREPEIRMNGRPLVYECEKDGFKKARCFKWFSHFLFENRGLGRFQQLY